MTVQMARVVTTLRRWGFRMASNTLRDEILWMLRRDFPGNSEPWYQDQTDRFLPTIESECQKREEALLDELAALIELEEVAKPIGKLTNTSSFVWASTLNRFITSKRRESDA